MKVIKVGRLTKDDKIEGVIPIAIIGYYSPRTYSSKEPFTPITYRPSGLSCDIRLPNSTLQLQLSQPVSLFLDGFSKDVNYKDNVALFLFQDLFFVAVTR